MMTISFYNQRGEITSELFGDQVVIDLTKKLTTDAWVEGAWFGQNKYVSEGVVLSRPDNTATVSGQTLENVPIPATVIVNGSSYETNEATIELDFNQPGTYLIKVVAWPYLDKEFLIENPTL